MTAETKPLPVWYFIGWLLLIYGILIVGVGTGVLEVSSASVTADPQIGVWWGALLIVIGLTYVCCFRRGNQGSR
jgi:hypothetical protein